MIGDIFGLIEKYPPKETLKEKLIRFFFLGVVILILVAAVYGVYSFIQNF